MGQAPSNKSGERLDLVSAAVSQSDTCVRANAVSDAVRTGIVIANETTKNARYSWSMRCGVTTRD